MDARSILQIILDTQYFRNGHTDQASVPTAGDSSNTFHLPKDQGKSVLVCDNSEDFSPDNCHTYQATGSDMSVSLPAISSHSIKHHLNLFKIF